jgi:hypothetical protein
MNMSNDETSLSAFPSTGQHQNVAETLPVEPILEAVHLRKYFPLRGIKLLGPQQVVHAVEDTSLAL